MKNRLELRAEQVRDETYYKVYGPEQVFDTYIAAMDYVQELIKQGDNIVTLVKVHEKVIDWRRK